MPVASPTPQLPLVGRNLELSLLRPHLAAATDDHGSLVMIGGPAGVGKTALAEMLAREAEDLGAHVLTGHCSDLTETPPYGPWREIVQRIQAIALPADVPPMPHLDTATSQASLFAQTRDFLVAATMDRPFLLLLEDLHWADPAFIDLLRHVARTLASLPLLLVVTYRADELDRRHPLAERIPLLVREAPTEWLHLHPLDAAAVHALVRSRYDLTDEEIARLADYLVAWTEGNALFVVEFLRPFEEDGLLHREGGQWHVGAIVRASVPRLLRQIIEARLTRLGDDAGALLALAAVIGQEVPLAVWGPSRAWTRRRW